MRVNNPNRFSITVCRPSLSPYSPSKCLPFSSLALRLAGAPPDPLIPFTQPSFPPSFSLVQARPTSISIHTQPSRSSETKLGTAAIPELHLGVHDAAHTSETIFVVRDVNNIEVCAFPLP